MNVMNFASRSVICVEPGDSIDKAISLMEEFRIHHLVVRSGEHVVGMVSDRDVLLSVGWALASERRIGMSGRGAVIGPTTVDQIMARAVICIDNSQDAPEAAHQMTDRRIGALPVLHHGRLVGILTDTDLLFWLEKLATPGSAAARFLEQPVTALMRANVLTVGPASPLGDIVDIFRRRRVRHVPVVGGRRLVGIVSDRDVRRALGSASVRDMQAQEAGDFYVGPRCAADIMSSEVHTVDGARTLRGALGEMLERRIHSAPIVRNDELVGIITQTDFIRAIAREALL